MHPSSEASAFRVGRNLASHADERDLLDQHLYHGSGFSLLPSARSKHPPRFARRGCTIYFVVENVLRYAALIVDVGKIADKWIRFHAKWEKPRWKGIHQQAFVTWACLRETDDYEKNSSDGLPYDRPPLWKYVQVGPSPEQALKDWALLRRHLEERNEEWL